MENSQSPNELISMAVTDILDEIRSLAQVPAEQSEPRTATEAMIADHRLGAQTNPDRVIEFQRRILTDRYSLSAYVADQMLQTGRDDGKTMVGDAKLFLRTKHELRDIAKRLHGAVLDRARALCDGNRWEWKDTDIAPEVDGWPDPGPLFGSSGAWMSKRIGVGSRPAIIGIEPSDTKHKVNRHILRTVCETQESIRKAKLAELDQFKQKASEWMTEKYS